MILEETSLADRVHILSSEYKSITGESLNARIFDWLDRAGFELTEQDFRLILAKVPASALSHLTGLLEREMKGDRVAEALRNRVEPEVEKEEVDSSVTAEDRIAIEDISYCLANLVELGEW